MTAEPLISARELSAGLTDGVPVPQRGIDMHVPPGPVESQHTDHEMPRGSEQRVNGARR
jgi:hypothetical protein